MAKFNIDKKGYNPEEVDEYINNLYLKYEDKLAEQKDRVIALKNEVESLNEKLNSYAGKDEQISRALIYAVEKSEQIENNAKSVYNLEVKRINNLYARWEELLLEIESKYPDVNKNRSIKAQLNEFKEIVSDINSKSLTFNSKSIKDELRANSDNFIKNILNRMDYVVNSKPLTIAESKPKKQSKPVSNKNVEGENKNPAINNLSDRIKKVEQKPVAEVKVAEEPKKVVLPKKSFELKVKPEPTEMEPQHKPLPKKSFELKSEVVKTEKPQPKQDNVPKSMLAMSSISSRLSKLTGNSKNAKGGAEKFLNSDEDLEINAYSKNFAKKKLEKKNTSPFNYMTYPEPNESGFDLKEALNPKEDLDEIMKSFDFFDED